MAFCKRVLAFFLLCVSGNPALHHQHQHPFLQLLPLPSRFIGEGGRGKFRLLPPPSPLFLPSIQQGSQPPLLPYFHIFFPSLLRWICLSMYQCWYSRTPTLAMVSCCSQTQPSTVACKMEAQSEYVHIACTFLHVWHQFACSVDA